MNLIALIISLLISLFCGYAFRKSLIDSMSNVHVAKEAQEYLKRDTVNITTVVDTYLYTNISVVPKAEHHDNQEQDNDSSDSDNDSGEDFDSGDSDGGDGGDGGD